MSETLLYVLMVLGVVGCMTGFRVLLEIFCVRTDRKVRLLCVAGMMALYTVVMTWEIYIVGEMLVQGVFFELKQSVSVIDYRNMICAIFPVTNLLMGSMIMFYVSQIKKHILSNREKIMLKDM